MVHAVGSEEIADKHRHLVALFGAGRVDPVKKFAEGRRELAGLMVGRVFRHGARLTRTAIRGARFSLAARDATIRSGSWFSYSFPERAIAELTLNDGTTPPRARPRYLQAHRGGRRRGEARRDRPGYRLLDSAFHYEHVPPPAAVTVGTRRASVLEPGRRAP